MFPPAHSDPRASRPVKLLAFGFVGALLAHSFRLTRAPLETLKILFHEIGHAVVATILGCPSIPAFDFMFGGGFTHVGNFQPLLAIVIAAAIAYAGWRFRDNAPMLAATALGALVWLVCVSSEWRRETTYTAAGVIFELLLAATFLYMALANVGWRKPEIERPLVALIAFFVLFDSWLFSFRLIRDADFLEWYQAGKGGALMNDLEVVALNLKIHLGLNATIRGLAVLLFLFSFAPIGAAFLLYLRTGEDVVDSL